MKNSVYFFLLTLIFSTLSFPQNVWINEFSYDCAGDGDEFIEIVAPVGTDMSQYGVVFCQSDDGQEYYAHTYAQLSEKISSTNSNNGKGFFVVLTDRSHLIESNTPIPFGIKTQTVNGSLIGLSDDWGGILLVYSATGEVIQGLCYEMSIETDLPGFINNRLTDAPFSQDFDLFQKPIDAIRLPLEDGGNSTPNGSISMIGTGFSRIWTTTIGDAPNISTPGALNYSQGALPVELSSFTASIIKNGVKLNWRTETEVNNYGFDVERKSVNGNWDRLNFVSGNGNSNSPKDYSFTDQELNSGKYSYRLKQIDNNGSYSFSKSVEIDFDDVKVYNLTQNYPNPFNPTTAIKFTLPQSGNVKLIVYNLLGQETKTLINGFREAGVHNINFNAEGLNSGIYIYKIESGSFTQTRKMTLLK